jgi:hypothetical protein
MNAHLSEATVSKTQIDPSQRIDSLPRIGRRFVVRVGESVLAGGVVGIATFPELGVTVGALGVAGATVRAGIDCAGVGIRRFIH